MYLRSGPEGTHHSRREKSALASDQSPNGHQSNTLKIDQFGTGKSVTYFNSKLFYLILHDVC